MTENQNNNDNKEDPTKNGWWSRCRRGMSNVWEFAQKHSTQYLLQIRRLQQLSKIAGWAFVSAGAFGVPGATMASVACFTFSQSLKLVGDQTKDVKDLADDLEVHNYENEAESRMDSNEDRIRELEAMVEEQSEIIRAQMQSGEALKETHSSMQGVLQLSGQEIKNLKVSHDQLSQALRMMLEAEKTNDGDVRSEHRNKYARELGAAAEEGLIEPTDFDPDEDDLVRLEGEHVENLHEGDEEVPAVH